MKFTFIAFSVIITFTTLAAAQNSSIETNESSGTERSAIHTDTNNANAITDIKYVKKIFIDPMPNNLDQFLRVEFQKQLKGKVSIVLVKEAADAILTGTGDWQHGTGATITGRYLGLHDTATGAVSLVSADGKTLLWAGEAGDRSLWWGAMARGGPRKVADRIVSKLKHDMGHE